MPPIADKLNRNRSPIPKKIGPSLSLPVKVGGCPFWTDIGPGPKDHHFLLRLEIDYLLFHQVGDAAIIPSGFQHVKNDFKTYNTLKTATGHLLVNIGKNGAGYR